jgi:hypothetical protein
MRIVLLAAALAAGCAQPRQDFVCRGNAQCVLGGDEGTCEATGFCSFPDSGCDSGRRYGSAAEGELAGLCVELLAPPLGSWAGGAAYDTPRRNHAAAVHGDFLYILGGFSGEHEADVQVARIEDGSIDAWAPATPLPMPWWSHTAAAHDGFLYVIGGNHEPGPFSSSVMVAPIAADGSLGEWSESRPLPGARRSHASVLVGDDLYVAGGKVSSSESSAEVFRARLSGGSIASWVPAGSFEGPRHGHALASDGAHLFVVGGCTFGSFGCDDTLADVQVATIEEDGSLSPFRATAPLPIGRRDLDAIAAGGYLFAISGAPGDGTRVEVVDAAFIHPDGSLAPWQEAFPISRGVSRARILHHGSYLVLLGQFSPFVQIAPLL